MSSPTVPYPTRSRVARALLMSAVGLALAPAASLAETYTFNGGVAPRSVATAEGVMCAALPSPDGTTACFDSEARLRDAVRKDVVAGRVPPGYNLFPEPAEVDRILGVRNADVSASAARHPNRRVRAHAACSNGLSQNHIYAAAAWTGTQQYFASSSFYAVPLNSNINNGVTSFRDAEYYVYYHDGPNGTGGLGTYYDGASTHCVQRGNLATTDPSWDNTFSSYSSGA